MIGGATSWGNKVSFFFPQRGLSLFISTPNTAFTIAFNNRGFVIAAIDSKLQFADDSKPDLGLT